MELSGTVFDSRGEQQRVHRKPVAFKTYQVVSKHESSISDDSDTISAVPLGRGPSLVRTWWVESLACMLALAALAGIVVTLRAVQDQPLPNLPYHISVNTLIAFIATLMKVPALFILTEGLSQEKWSWFSQPRTLHDFQMYDNASRGPWGALQLMWRLRCKPIVATFGAIVVIAATLVDPLSQQLVRFRDCVEMVVQIAKIPRTNDYDDIGPRISAGIWAVNLGLIDSMAAGQFSSSPPPVSYTCSSANCTFDSTYSTVGYCSDCSDISDRLSFQQNNSNYNAGDQTTLYLAPTHGYNVSMFTANMGVDTGISGRFALKARDSVLMAWFDDLDDSHEPLGHAYECSIQPCVYNLKATVVNGTLNEQVQRTTAFSLSYS